MMNNHRQGGFFPFVGLLRLFDLLVRTCLFNRTDRHLGLWTLSTTSAAAERTLEFSTANSGNPNTLVVVHSSAREQPTTDLTIDDRLGAEACAALSPRRQSHGNRGGSRQADLRAQRSQLELRSGCGCGLLVAPELGLLTSSSGSPRGFRE